MHPRSRIGLCLNDVTAGAAGVQLLAMAAAVLLLVASGCTAQPPTSKGQQTFNVQHLQSRLASLPPQTRAAMLQALQKQHPEVYARYLRKAASSTGGQSTQYDD